jgi:hypothetical protein
MEDAIAKAREEVVKRNTMTALKAVDELRLKVNFLEALIRTQDEKLGLMNNKINLMLTKSFNGGSTANVD